MANINKAIRFYQPNDPYYWEVDNLPLTDLLTNDIVLDEKIAELKTLLDGIGSGGGGGGTGGGGGGGGGTDTSFSGSVALESISNLKAFTTPDADSSYDHGKVFVREGKFIARMNTPATRENGSRMMRDDPIWWNNISYQTQMPGLSTTQLDNDFVRKTNAIGRTAVVQFTKYQPIESPEPIFQRVQIDPNPASDYNGDNPPSERLDLIYIEANNSLDTDGDSPTATDHVLNWGTENKTYRQAQHGNLAKLGCIQGAFFRTDGINDNGMRLDRPTGSMSTNPSHGRIMGTSQADVPASTNLPGFGSIPMPDDLVNQSNSTYVQNAEAFALEQIHTHPVFSLPIAYVRVPLGYQIGDPISNENVIDIRPFLRTTELTYNERAGIMMGEQPNGDNPFVTESALTSKTGSFTSDIERNRANIAMVSGVSNNNAVKIAAVEPVSEQNDYDLNGPLTLGADLISRVGVLEAGGAGGGGGGGGPLGVTVPHWSEPVSYDRLFAVTRLNDLNNYDWVIDAAHIHTNNIPGILYGNFRMRITSNGAGWQGDYVNMNVGGSNKPIWAAQTVSIVSETLIDMIRFTAPINYDSATGTANIKFGACNGWATADLWLDSYMYGVDI